jgi:osmotically inducible protein OsmC
MFKRTSTANWQGTGLEGKGTLTLQSGVLKDQPYSFKTRFQSEDGKAGTNPEELIAAAHAGCFAMALSFILTGAGHPPEALDVSAVVTMKSEGVHWSVAGIELKLQAKVSGIDSAKFQELAEQAKSGCPISKALSAVPIALDAKLA